jgi:dienelactone hydrolase
MNSGDPRMVHNHYLRRVQESMRERHALIAGLRGRKDAERYVATVRRRIQRVFGAFPGPRLLGARTTGTFACDGFVIEKVLLESRPRFYITGNLYVPRKARAGRGGAGNPAVLGLCGHSPAGKAEPAYQSFCQGLALKGFVVFIIDPISQGERPQFYESEGSPMPDLCAGHNAIGSQLALVGDFFGSWRARDAMTALDYLVSRPEVDASRVGATGNSGGGTLASYLTALDPRLSMAAPSCFIGSYEANILNELPSDAEQNPPGMIAAGLDQADLLIAHAPRPTLILSQYDDFFDERYARQAHEEVRRIHRLLGSGGTARFFCGTTEHGFHRENREAMYGFFQEFAGMPIDPEETGVSPLDPALLQVTPGGDVAGLGSRPVRTFARAKARALERSRPGLDTGEDLVRLARRVLRVPRAAGEPSWRCLTWLDNRTDAAKPRHLFAVETEPGIEAYVTTFGPTHPVVHTPRPALTLHVCHEPWEQELAATPELLAKVRSSKAVAIVDPRGMGRSFSATCGSSSPFEPYGSDFLYASTADMLGESLLGRRVFDLMRVMDSLLANGATRLDLMGRGIGSLVVAFAALLHASRPRALLLDYLPSFASLTRGSAVRWPFSSLPRGVLAHFDLPDVYAALAGRLSKRRPWDAAMTPRAGEPVSG